MSHHEPSWVMSHPILGFGEDKVCVAIRPRGKRPAASEQVVGLPRYRQDMATILPSFKLRSAELSSQILVTMHLERSWSLSSKEIMKPNETHRIKVKLRWRNDTQCNLNISQCNPDIHFVADWTQTGDAETLIALHLMQHELWIPSGLRQSLRQLAAAQTSSLWSWSVEVILWRFSGPTLRSLAGTPRVIHMRGDTSQW